MYFNGFMVLTKSVSVTDFEDIVDGTASKIVQNIQTNGELGVLSVMKISTSVLRTAGVSIFQGAFGNIVLACSLCHGICADYLLDILGIQNGHIFGHP